MPETLGVRLRRIRTHEGLSQNHLAARSGIPKSRLSRYENDHLLPSIPTLKRLAMALDVPEGALLADPRASYEAFADVLERRGIRFDTVEQAQDVAEAFVDYVRASEASAG